MTANDRIVRLFGKEIVLDHRATALQISLNFSGWRYITKTVVVEGTGVTFAVRHPVSSRSTARVQVDDGALFGTRSFTDELIAHENPAKVGDPELFHDTSQFSVC